MRAIETGSDRVLEARADESRGEQDPNPTLAPPGRVIDELVAAVGRAGIGLDRDAAREWLHAVADAIATPGEFSRTTDGEFGGHELALIDFDPAAAVRLRQIGRLIATPRTDGVATALAIAGSA